MTVKDLIIELLNTDINKEVSVEYPTSNGKIVGNYSRYDVADTIRVVECDYGIIIEVA